MKEQQIQVNMNINDGEAFFAHETSVNFGPLQFVFDFKSVTPRVDQRCADGQAVISLKHNVILVEPWHAKMIHEALSAALGKHEEQFGKIELPATVKALLKDNKELFGGKKIAPSYFG